MDISSATLGAISASIAVPIFMGVMRAIKKLSPLHTSEKSLDQLTREYSRWEFISSLAIFVLTAGITFLLWKVLVLLANFHHSHLAASIQFIGPPDIIWLLPALFLAIFIAVIPLHFSMVRLLGRERYAEFIEYGNRKHNLNTWKLLGYMACFFIPASLAFSLLTFDSYIRLTDQSFIVNRFFSLGEAEYHSTDINYIGLIKSYKAPNGNTVRRPYYSIGFSDGTAFSFHNSVVEAELPQQALLADHLSQMCGVTLSISDPYPE